MTDVPVTARRRLAAGLMVVTGLVLLSLPAAAQEPRVDTDLIGYDLEATATPLATRFFEDFIPIPVDPGDPNFELTTSYTESTLTTGPLSRSVASTLWPGSGVGDGYGSVACAFDQSEDCDDSQEYPVSARAEYPGSTPEDWSGQQTFGPSGIGMFALAQGLDNLARAEGGGIPGIEAVVDVGRVRAESETTVRDGLSYARSLSETSEVSIAGGVVVLDAVTTSLEAVSDGENASTSGETVIGGITVAGMQARLTDTGLVVVPGEQDGDDAPEDDGDGPGALVDGVLDPVNQLLNRLTSDLVADGVEDTLGIRVEAPDHEQTLQGPIAERLAAGVTITIETQALADYLRPLLGTVGFADLVGGLPEDQNQLKGLLLELSSFAPTIEIVMGRGFVAASASPPFELPPLPPPATGGGFPSSGTGSSGSSGGLVVPPATGTDVTDTPPASVAPPPTTTVAPPTTPTADPIDPVNELPPIVVGLALVLAAVPTWGLRTLRENAVGVGAATRPDTDLPDLRGGI